jgi:magnesium transporter
MAESDFLTNAYLAAHPDGAARVLEQLPDEEAAALFESAPVRLGAPVLSAMLPHTAARCVLRLETPRAAMLLAAVSFPSAAAILRNMPEPPRTLLLDAMPTATALGARALLGYPEDSVGACVDSEIIALPPDRRASDALEALRAARVVPSGPVFVVDAQRRPLGKVELPELVRAGAQERLDTLMVAAGDLLPAMTPLAGADTHRVWQDTDVVPVVERGGGLVGVVRRNALRQAQGRRTLVTDPPAQSLTGALVLGYWNAVSGLIEATLSLLAAPRRGPP